MYTLSPQIDTILLLGGGSLALLGVIGLTTHHTYQNGHGVESYLRENSYGIIVALVVILICVLEGVGFDWDRGVLNWMLGFRDEKRERTEKVELEEMIDDELGGDEKGLS